MFRSSLYARLVITATLVGALSGAAPAFAGDRQVHPGAACQQAGYEDASATTWRALSGYLENQAGHTESFICPAVNDTITTGVSAAIVYAYGKAQCFAGVTAWGALGGAFTPIKTGTAGTTSYLDLGSLTTPGSSTFGSYYVNCYLPHGARILHYYINQK